MPKQRAPVKFAENEYSSSFLWNSNTWILKNLVFWVMAGIIKFFINKFSLKSDNILTKVYNFIWEFYFRYDLYL